MNEAPFLAGILDAEYGGRFEIAPIDTIASYQRYTEDSCVLVTSLVSRRGVLQVTDTLTLRSGADLSEPVPAGRSELLRHARAVGGDVPPSRGRMIAFDSRRLNLSHWLAG